MTSDGAETKVQASPDLVQACQQGDRVAMRQLFEIHRDPMFRLASRFTMTPEDASDLTQEILLRMFERIHTFRQEARFSTWLYRLALNVCLNHRRKMQSQGLPELLEDSHPDVRRNPAEACTQRELAQHIEDAVTELPEVLRSVFVLVNLEGFSYHETAEVLELSIESVRMRMSRARKQMRDRLRTYLEA